MMENKHGRTDLLTQKQIDWCDEHCDFEWFAKDDGKVYSKDERVYFKDINLIVSFFVKFGDCKYFSCFNCELLKSLEGAPERVYGYFNCSWCHLLKSLKGAPESVTGYFNCSRCDLLKSLEGAPKFTGMNFDCSYCKSLKFIDGLKNTKIIEKIIYHGCSKLKKYDFILSNMNWFCKWQNSEYTADEFLKEYDGFLQARKYGI